jgi:hypothetical protein
MLLLFRSLLGLDWSSPSLAGYMDWVGGKTPRRANKGGCRHVCLGRGMLAEEGSGVLQLLAAENECTARSLPFNQKHGYRRCRNVNLFQSRLIYCPTNPIPPISYLEKEVRRRRLGRIITSATPTPTSQTSSHSPL